MDIVHKTRKFLRRGFQDIADRNEASIATRFGFSAAQGLKMPIQNMPIQKYSDLSNEMQQLAPETNCEVTPPVQFGQQQDASTRRFDAIHMRQFKNTVASGCASALAVGSNIALPNLYAEMPGERFPTERSFCGMEQTMASCVFIPEASQRKSGILLFGSGTYNWYHWLIEQLPAAFLAEQLGEELSDVPFIVPEQIQNIPSFMDSLSLFGHGRPVEAIDNKPYEFEDLYVIDPPIQEPINMPRGCWPRSVDYAFHPEVMRDYRSAIIERLGIETKQPTRRLFLARGHGRRSYDQDEALQIAAEFGFEAVYPERLSFREQVQTMHDAAFVVGPSGAAFANTLFCQEGTRLLSWLIPQYKGFCSYANLAAITKSELSYIFTPTARPVNSTSEAYSVSYQLDAKELENALHQLTKDENQT